MKIVFMGTPEFAIPSLEVCNKFHEVIGVISQPDRPRGRGGAVTPSPLKKRAIELNLPVFTFEKIGSEGVDTLKSLNPDIMVTAAYGQILTDEILQLAPHGVINVHGSILPKYRGSSPVQHAILCGENVTGVTIMQTARAVDSGDVIEIAEVKIEDGEGADSLLKRLSFVGADTLKKVLDDIEKGIATFTPQDHGTATFCKMLTKQDAIINWNESADIISRKIRAFDMMGATSTLKGGILKMYAPQVVHLNGRPGEVIEASDKTGVTVACGEGAVRLGELLLAGGKRLSSCDIVRGRKIVKGDILGV